MSRRKKIGKFGNTVIVVLPFILALVVISLAVIALPNTWSVAFLCIALLSCAFINLIYARRTKCKKCGSFYGNKVISKVEKERTYITWTEKKNFKGLATNSLFEVVHGVLIQYDAVMMCRYCKEEHIRRLTVRKRV